MTSGFSAGRVGALALAAAVAVLGAPRAQAFEFFDGRIQAHGFFEEQIRALSSSYSEELDLAQWYNVLNVELEFDIFPDGFGPIDLMSAYVRLEGRYDCVWKRGCGMFPSVDTYGDRVKRLPHRLRDGQTEDYAGVIRAPYFVELDDGVRGGRVRVVPGNVPLTLEGVRVQNPNTRAQTDSDGDFIPDIVENQFGAGSPILGLDWGFQNPPTVQEVKSREGIFSFVYGTIGADGIPGTMDDPGIATFREFTDYVVTVQDFRGPATGDARVLGPWRPKDFIQESALFYDRANPFRGRATPTGRTRLSNAFLSCTTPDCRPGGEFGPSGFDAMAALTTRNAALMANAPFVGAGAAGIVADPFPADLAFFLNHPLNRNGVAIFPFREVTNPQTGLITSSIFGGDYAGIVPCLNPAESGVSNLNAGQLAQFTGINENDGCIARTLRNRAEFNMGDPDLDGDGFPGWDGPSNSGVQHPNIEVVGGRAENPLRPAPDRSNLSPFFDKRTAQGLYIPSSKLVEYMRDNDLDSHPFNIREAERAWNRGDSQQDEKELKEAFAEFEFFDSRLWLKVGKQSIVWGKTELFRTTDQFNPQDLSLSTLPGLEESRIALWSARAIYSLYNVGPLEDVRVEFAMNFDQFEPNDLGACGEPYVFDVVCALTFGIFAHSVLGLGVAGFDRPPDPWESPEGLEYGGRVEWRWDRFSFALTDFYGFNDFPFPERISTYERNVDPWTGRPLIAGSGGRCTGLVDPSDPTGEMWTAANADPKDWASMTVAGIGRDPACLKPGGAPLGRNESSGLNENGFGPGIRRAVAAVDNPSTLFDDTITPCVPNVNDLGLAGLGCSGPPLRYDAGAGMFMPTTPATADPVYYVMNTKGALVTRFRTDGMGNRIATIQPSTAMTPVTEIGPLGGGLNGTTALECQPGLTTGGMSASGIQVYGFGAADGTVCRRARALNGQRQNLLGATTGVAPGGIPGASPQNALEYHPANQQIFAWICAITVTIAPAIDGQACAWTIFASGAPLNEQLFPIPLSEVVGVIFAGEPDGGGGGTRFLQVVNDAQRDVSGPAESFLVVPLNRDPNDGTISVLDSGLNRDGSTLNNMGLGPAGYFLPDPEDMLTLDSTLTNEQRALLGCGPFYGTRCDSAAKARRVGNGANQALVPFYFGGLGASEQGGIDFINMEASVLVQSLVGADGTALWDFPFAAFPATLPGPDGVTGTTDDVAGPVAFAPGSGIYSATSLPSRQRVGAGSGTAFEIDCPLDPNCLPGFDYTRTQRLSQYVKDGLWTTTSVLPQPGTIDFHRVVGGPICSREVGGALKILPGCRGALDVKGRETALATGVVTVIYEHGYDPNIDGCVFATTLRPLDPNTGARVSIDVVGIYPDGTPVNTQPCEPGVEINPVTQMAEASPARTPSECRTPTGTPDEQRATIQDCITGTRRGDFTRVLTGNRPAFAMDGAGTLYHPFAGCHRDPVDAIAGVPCNGVPFIPGNPNGIVPFGRDFDTEYVIEQTSQVFYNELAGFSFNFMQFLMAASCNDNDDDIANDPECFDQRTPWKAGKCSWTTPQFCSSVKAFFTAAGVLRNTTRAAGNRRFGRRTFLWHGGGEVVLAYEKRNVLGFSLDFAEDVTKSNWGMEFTWISGVPFIDANERDNVRKADTLNLTVSVDRPTFINFLNPNRTFFINSQWFFQYIPEYRNGFTSNGPLNVLFTVAVFTGYFQDRLLPTMVTVYDFNSQSGGFLPSITYRFNESFSATVGMSIFFGKTQLDDMAVNPVGPPANRAGPDAYQDGNDQLLSNFRNKDEFFLRLRYTF